MIRYVSPNTDSQCPVSSLQARTSFVLVRLVLDSGFGFGLKAWAREQARSAKGLHEQQRLPIKNDGPEASTARAKTTYFTNP
jgi:hypothetical protein